MQIYYKVLAFQDLVSPFNDFFQTAWLTCKRDWIAMPKRLFEHELYKTEPLPLPENLANSFMTFIEYSPQLTCDQKHQYQTRESEGTLSTFDIIFFHLEMNLPFKSNTLGRTISDSCRMEEVKHESFVKGVKYSYALRKGVDPHEVIITQLNAKIDSIKENQNPYISIDTLESLLISGSTKDFLLASIMIDLKENLHQIKYPLSLNNTGHNIYVGQTPRSYQDYF